LVFILGWASPAKNKEDIKMRRGKTEAKQQYLRIFNINTSCPFFNKVE
jgi:hypothetical protein